MVWDRLYFASTNRSGEFIDIPQPFTSLELVIETTIYRRIYTRRSVGHLLPKFFVPEIGLVEGKREYLRHGTQKVIMRNTETPYFLSFYLSIWVLQLDLAIWEDKSRLTVTPFNLQEQIAQLEEKLDTSYGQ